jgi:hypothetical protein
MKKILSWWRRLFPKYRRITIRFVSYSEAERLIRESADKPEPEKWVIAVPEEDRNRIGGWVYLERRVRIT